MYSTPLDTILAALPALTETERHRLLTDPHLTSLAAVFACIPAPVTAPVGVIPCPFCSPVWSRPCCATAIPLRRWSNGAANSAPAQVGLRPAAFSCPLWFALSPPLAAPVG